MNALGPAISRVFYAAGSTVRQGVIRALGFLEGGKSRVYGSYLYK